MSFFAFGAMFAGLIGAKIIARIGHIRAFALMAALLVIITVLHSFYDSLWLTAFLRGVAGYAMVVNFIALESWLNVITDRTNRGKVFSIYQICIAIGGVSAPFVLSGFVLNDPRIFGLMALFLSVSIIMLSATKLPIPEISEKTSAMPFRELWAFSPSGTLSSFCAGLITSVSISLITLYTSERELTGLARTMILSSVLLGGLLTQYPTGWFADRLDKRSVAATLMGIGMIFNCLIILDSNWPLPQPLLVISFLISGGTAAALFPLSVTQVFDHIDPKDALRATGTLQIILGLGGFMGPIIAGSLMDAFNTMSLFYYIAAVHFFVMTFLLVRRVFIRQERLTPTFPYQISTQQTRMCRTGLDPRTQYNVADVGDPELKLLLLALAQHPSDPGILIKTALNSARLHPIDIAVHLVMALPKQSDQLIAELVRLYPQARMEIAQSLKDLILLRKHRINALVKEGLSEGATPAEKAEISTLIQSALDNVTEYPSLGH
jgi:MFS family permease